MPPTSRRVGAVLAVTALAALIAERMVTLRNREETRETFELVPEERE